LLCDDGENQTYYDRHFDDDLVNGDEHNLEQLQDEKTQSKIRKHEGSALTDRVRQNC